MEKLEIYLSDVVNILNRKMDKKHSGITAFYKLIDGDNSIFNIGYHISKVKASVLTSKDENVSKPMVDVAALESGLSINDIKEETDKYIKDEFPGYVINIATLIEGTVYPEYSNFYEYTLNEMTNHTLPEATMAVTSTDGLLSVNISYLKMEDSHFDDLHTSRSCVTEFIYEESKNVDKHDWIRNNKWRLELVANYSGNQALSLVEERVKALSHLNIKEVILVYAEPSQKLPTINEFIEKLL